MFEKGPDIEWVFTTVKNHIRDGTILHKNRRNICTKKQWNYDGREKERNTPL